MSWTDHDAWASIEATQAAADAKAEAKRAQRLAERGMQLVPDPLRVPVDDLPAPLEVAVAAELPPERPYRVQTWYQGDGPGRPPIKHEVPMVPKGDPVLGVRAYLKYLQELLRRERNDD